jgi:hypothetical protein
MSEMIPSARPQLAKPDAIKMLARNGVGIANGYPALLGVRGFYKTQGRNNWAIYDDCIALVSMFAYGAYNANCDPSRHHPGVAVLQPGVYSCQVGMHGLSKPVERQYEALVQAGPVTVAREGGTTETGWFGINVHRGGAFQTSSEGCQTIVPGQWDAFLSAVKAELARAKVTHLPYVLVDAA